MDPTEPAPTLATPPPIKPPEPRSPTAAIDMSRSNLTQGLINALSRAQQKAKTIGKASRNEGGGGQRPYNYASADNMIRAARELLAAEGIAWVCSSRLLDPPTLDLGDKQWVCSLVRTESVVMFADDDSIGTLFTIGECISVGSGGRPPDKADKAADTYLRGFIARDLLALDRAEVPKDEEVDQRVDDSSARSGGRRPAASAQSAAETELRDRCNTLVRMIQEARTADGRPRPTIGEITHEAMGDAAWRPGGLEDYRELVSRLEELVPKTKSAAKPKSGAA